jgi:hypothetical protein
MYTLLPCVTLKKVSENDCPCIPAPGCMILRSEHKLPKPVNSKSGYILDSVMSINGAIIFHEVTYKSKIWRKDDKYTSAKPDYFIKDDYLYITSTRKLKAVSVIGLFADPVEASTYPSYCNETEESCPINPVDLEFPIDEVLIDVLVEMTAKELSEGFRLGSEDTKNDSMDDKDDRPSPRQTQSRQQPQQRKRR